MRGLLRDRRSAARRPAPARAGRHGAAAIAAASRIRRSRMRRAAGGCLWEMRRLEKWERAGQVESRGRGENCRKRQKRLYCSEKVRFGGVFLLTCRLLVRKRPFPQKRSPPEGACQPLCSAKRPPRPLVGDRRGFQFPRLLSHPRKTPPSEQSAFEALRASPCGGCAAAWRPTPLLSRLASSPRKNGAQLTLHAVSFP